MASLVAGTAQTGWGIGATGRVGAAKCRSCVCKPLLLPERDAELPRGRATTEGMGSPVGELDGVNVSASSRGRSRSNSLSGSLKSLSRRLDPESLDTGLRSNARS
ncbi:MAG TPA: hypothetical protein VII18_04910 [Mycobacterium sp.]